MTRETWMLNHLMHDIRQYFKTSDELKQKVKYYNRGLMTLGELLREAGTEVEKLERIALEAEWEKTANAENGEKA